MKSWLRSARPIGRNAQTCSSEKTSRSIGWKSLSGLAALGALAIAPSALAQYCAAGATFCSAGGAEERITRVQFGSINNSSGTGSGPAGCYTNNTAMSANVDTGGTYLLTVENLGPGSAYPPDDSCSAWFDWNQNNVFDAAEQFNLVGNAAQTVFTANVLVPPSALAGTTRMRVRLMYNDVPMSPCGTATYGEVEDYSVFVTVVSTGACCTGTSCAVTSSSSCAPADFRGASTTCSPNICQGACCDGGGNCSITAWNACSGPFVQAGTCSPNPCSYCTSTSNDCNTVDERISQFEFNDIVNPAAIDPSDGPVGCYTDWTAIGTTVFPGSTYNVVLHNTGPFTADQAAVWIDFNHDFAFGNVASGEQFNLTIGVDTANGATVAGSLFTGTITIPAGAPLGTTRMRARIVFNTAPVPCGNLAYGETEDYTITIQAATVGACCAAGNGTCAATTPGACASGFQGLATSCAPSNPCGGACCDSSGNCTVTLAAGCTGPGNSFAASAVCSATVCNGSCCDSNGVCTSVIASACTGTFSGVGTTCASNPCPAPSNDDCATVLANSAPIIPPTGGTVTGNLITSTNDGTSSCQASAGKDVYYLFTPSIASSWSFSTCTGSDAIDTLISVHSNTCPVSAATQVGGASACVDQGCGAGNLSLIPALPLTMGETYIVRVALWSATGTTGTFTLEVASVTAGACCDDTTGACTIVTTGICAAGATYQGDNIACSATQCGQGGCCNPTTGGCTLATAAGCVSPNVFQSVASTCTPNPCPQPPPPTNDECDTAIPLMVGVSVSGVTTGASQSVTATCTGTVKDLWYTFTAPTGGGAFGFTASISPGSTTNFMPSVSIYTVCPAANGGNSAAPDGCQAQGGTGFVQRAGMVGGEQIWIRVADFNGDNTAFDLIVNPVVVGACCNDTTAACTTVNTGLCPAGATYQGDNTACVPTTPCQAEACCNAGTGVCTTASLGQCAVGTSGQGLGTTCTPNPCPQPPSGACCNSSTGACTQVFQANCNVSTSVYSGDNTTCDGSGFCPAVGTCCSSLGNCTVRFVASCASGLTSNAATACSTGLCPPTGASICENFDSGTVGTLPSGWTSTSTGAGAPWVIDSVQSNSVPNSVFTNDVGTVSSQFLELPAVTAGSSGTLTLDFLSFYDTEATFDGWVVEYSTDAGGSWTDVVVGGTWVLNGYNQAAISVNFNSPIMGRPAFSGASTAWTNHIATIPATSGQSVIFRFHMACDSSVTDVGVWLDNICIGGIQGGGGGGVCCRGATCNTTIADSAACTASLAGALAGAAYPTGSCNSGGSTTSPCCFPDYNKVNGVGVPDIFDFLNDWFAGRLFANVGGDGNTGTLAVQNIFDFLNAWFAGGC